MCKTCLILCLQKKKQNFCDIALDYLGDSELVDVLKDRNCDWSDFGLKEE